MFVLQKRKSAGKHSADRANGSARAAGSDEHPSSSVLSKARLIEDAMKVVAEEKASLMLLFPRSAATDHSPHMRGTNQPLLFDAAEWDSIAREGLVP